MRKFGLSDKLTRNEISKYERGVREPALSSLLKYARAAVVNVEVLMDDDLDSRGRSVNKRRDGSRLLKGRRAKGDGGLIVNP